MEATARQQKLDIVWASVFVALLSLLSLVLVLVFMQPARYGEATAASLMIGGLLAVFNAVQLLGRSSESGGTLAVGRTFLWLSFVGLVVAAVLGVLSL